LKPQGGIEATMSTAGSVSARLAKGRMARSNDRVSVQNNNLVEPNLEMFTQQGFAKEKAAKALQTACGDVDVALCILLSEADDEIAPTVANTSALVLDPNVEEFECQICRDDVEPFEGMKIRACGHQWCKGCATHYLETRRLDAGATSSLIPCPADGCRGSFSQVEVEALIGSSAFASLDRRALEHAASSDPNLYPCKTPDCTYVVYYDANVDGTPKFECPQCRAVRCLLCDAEPYHDGVDCEGRERQVRELQEGMMTSEEKGHFSHDEQLTLLQIRAKKWKAKPGAAARQKLLQAQEEEQSRKFLRAMKACPRCRVPFQKISGCDHMTCRCGHEFCLKCGRAYPKECDTGKCQLEKARITAEQQARWMQAGHRPQRHQ